MRRVCRLVILENRQYQKTIRENNRKKKKEHESQAALSLAPLLPRSLFPPTRINSMSKIVHLLLSPALLELAEIVRKLLNLQEPWPETLI